MSLDKDARIGPSTHGGGRAEGDLRAKIANMKIFGIKDWVDFLIQSPKSDTRHSVLIIMARPLMDSISIQAFAIDKDGLDS